jgi:hypothetical protein
MLAMRKLWIALTLAALALFVSAPLVSAEGLYDDKVIFGDDFTLETGETITGNLIVMGGNVTIEDGARVADDLVVFGGNVELGGEVGGDVVTFGGNAHLLGTAVVEGRLVTSRGAITREEGAEVKGGESQGFSFNYGRPIPFLPEPLRPLDPLFAFVRDFVVATAVAVGAALLALLIALFLPEQTRRVSAAMTTAPVASGLLGLLTLIAGPVLIVLTAITLCLIPVSVLGAFVYAIAIVFGWLALGTLIGERLVASLRLHNVGVAVSALLGTFLITFLFRFFELVSNLGFGPFAWLLSCVSGIMFLALVSIGLGAVTLTRFGARPYLGGLSPVASASAVAAPAPSMSAPEAGPQSNAAIPSAAEPPPDSSPTTTDDQGQPSA